jgi:hypothetical protein
MGGRGLNAEQDIGAGARFWIIGGRWVEGGRQLPWPRVLGPFPDLGAARSHARRLEAADAPDARYLVVAAVRDVDVGQGAR